MVGNDRDDLDPTGAESALEKLKIGLELLPVVGGVMSELVSQYIAQRQGRRIVAALERLRSDLSQIQNRLNEEFLKSDAFADLFEEFLERSLEEKQAAKMDSLRSVFLSTLTDLRPSYDEASEMLALVAKMQPRHLTMLRILADPLTANADRGHPVGEGGGFSTSFGEIFGKLLPNWSRDEVSRTWEELKDWRIHNSGFGGMMTDRGIYHLQGRLTDFGKRVVHYLLSAA